ncbi:MAG: (deoxy)nucleoside triphosphate pyrophosphohydrolase [Victivallaceae bacterium]|nr:(deoxy)nucleoside triphosphate pyrophosphohydrolase [Victivallaceae bacterium]
MKVKKTIAVCAAVIRCNGKILLTTRPAGKHLAGMWEFPGGKIELGETPNGCLKREIIEELGIEVMTLDTIFLITHDYPDKSVKIRFIRCLTADTIPALGLEGQQVKWYRPDELTHIRLIEADRPFADFLCSSK